MKVSMLIAAIALSVAGCATVATPSGASFGQKLKDDEAVLRQAFDDVKTECGPQFASLAPAFAAVVAAASDPYNVTGDLLAVLDAYPAIVSDVKALACVYKVVVRDLKAAKPKAAAILEHNFDAFMAAAEARSNTLACAE